MFDTFQSDFIALFTMAGVMALIHIIIIDVVLSGDNAIIIGLATRKLPEKQRKKAIMIGIIGATVLRIIFAVFAVYLLQIIGIQLAGALLLLYVVWKIYTEIRGNHQEHQGDDKKNPNNLLNAIKLIIIADVSMSLDNVLAVAGAANENVVALGIGLLISIILMAFASNFIAKKLEEYPQIQWVGLLVILLVSIEMLLKGFEQIDSAFHFIIPTINFIGLVFFIIFLYAYKNIKYLHLPEVHFLEKWKYGKILFVPFALSMLAISLLSIFHLVELKGIHIIYTIFVLTMILGIEYIWIIKKRVK